MTPAQARALAHTLIEAAAEADSNEAEQVDLLTVLQQADNEARAELDAAIRAAEAGN